MKILFLFPPLDTTKGFPTYSQNRQFQYFKEPFFAYPLIAARLATQLLKEGHTVFWKDCIAEPSILPDCKSFDKVYIELKYPIYDEIMAMDIPNAVYYGEAAPNDPIDYDNLSWEIDRDLTKWWLYAYKNGNYSRLPGTYIQTAQGCWWSRCHFCGWQRKYKYKVRPLEDTVSEIETLVSRYGIKEIMDDSDTFPVENYLALFCGLMWNRGLHKKVKINCNMRFGVLTPVLCYMMKKAGFRMLLFGLESANQKTLDRIHKGITVDRAIEDCIMASKAGLQPHITVMFGFPWETIEDAKRTLHLAQWLLKKGYAWSAQASICVPYPNTPLYKYCKERSLLLTDDWSKFDQSQPVMKIPYSTKELFKLVKTVYKTSFHPKFLFHKLKCLKDLPYLVRIGKKIFGHIQ